MAPTVIPIQFDVPDNVTTSINLLKQAGFEAFLVGGCVRDLFMNRNPKDWDIATNAFPDEIIAVGEAYAETMAGLTDLELSSRGLAPRTDINLATEQSAAPPHVSLRSIAKGEARKVQVSRSSEEDTTVNFRVVYENTFGTVSFIFKDEELTSNSREVQITPYRTESGYSDSRRPDSVSFTRNLVEDITRRDFTMNALVYDIEKGEVLDYVGGIPDILSHTIRAIGQPIDRFSEDALRMMRACRFVSQLGFTIENNTLQAISQVNASLKNISAERIRDEFVKLIDGKDMKKGLENLRETGLLETFLPELMEGWGCEQSRSHVYDVYTHNINAGQTACDQNWPLHVKIASLFHDIGKPRSRRWDEADKIWTFYGHEVIGARMVNKIMKRLKFSREMSDRVELLVRYHMFFSDTETITLTAVRRMIRNVGEDLIWDLMLVRRSDRVGSGGGKQMEPYRLRKYESMIEEALRAPLSVKMLAINGETLMSQFHMKPGPRMGWILLALLEEVLEEPSRNTMEYFEFRIPELDQLNDTELRALGESGKELKDTVEEDSIRQLRIKHGVK